MIRILLTNTVPMGISAFMVRQQNVAEERCFSGFRLRHGSSARFSRFMDLGKFVGFDPKVSKNLLANGSKSNSVKMPVTSFTACGSGFTRRSASDTGFRMNRTLVILPSVVVDIAMGNTG